MASAPRTEDFRQVLQRSLDDAQRQGKEFLIVTAGDLHRRVGGYPGPNHRMPACCGAMRSLMRDGDQRVAGPDKGNGASLSIRYHLPRP
jgi:5-methylcytosine-specific restriction protein A